MGPRPATRGRPLPPDRMREPVRTFAFPDRGTSAAGAKSLAGRAAPASPAPGRSRPVTPGQPRSRPSPQRRNPGQPPGLQPCARRPAGPRRPPGTAAGQREARLPGIVGVGVSNSRQNFFSFIVSRLRGRHGISFAGFLCRTGFAAARQAKAGQENDRKPLSQASAGARHASRGARTLRPRPRPDRRARLGLSGCLMPGPAVLPPGSRRCRGPARRRPAAGIRSGCAASARCPAAGRRPRTRGCAGRRSGAGRRSAGISRSRRAGPAAIPRTRPLQAVPRQDPPRRVEDLPSPGPRRGGGPPRHQGGAAAGAGAGPERGGTAAGGTRGGGSPATSAGNIGA